MPEISVRGIEIPASPIRKLAPLAAAAKKRGHDHGEVVHIQKRAHLLRALFPGTERGLYLNVYVPRDVSSALRA